MTLAKWAARHGCRPSHAKQLRYFLLEYKLYGENALNGVNHPAAIGTKSVHADAWLQSRAKIGEKIEETARAAGFDRVDFGVGLVPVLEKGRDTCIFVPLADDEDD